MGDVDAKLLVTHASLFMRKVKLSSSVILAHAKALEKSTAKCPIKRVIIIIIIITRQGDLRLASTSPVQTKIQLK